MVELNDELMIKKDICKLSNIFRKFFWVKEGNISES